MRIASAIITACQAQDRAAQKQLYQQLWPYLNAICRRYLFKPEEAQDVLQEAFIRIFQYLDKYDPQKASFTTWAGRITINCCLKQNEAYRKHFPPEQIVPINEPQISPEVFSKLSNDDLLHLIRQLPPPLAEVLNLYCVDEFSHAEIAELLNISEALSRQRLSRARSWMKKKFPGGLSSNVHLNFL